MKLLGLQISRAATITKALAPPTESNRGWYPVIRESFTGAWQRNIMLHRENVLENHAVWACATVIAQDISKLRLKLIGLQSSGVWAEITNPAYSPVLRDPNEFQTDHQFVESWILSKLLAGNTYVLKRRDNRSVVNGLFILDPSRVRPLVADDGSVFYDLNSDNLSGLPERILVPAREVIHDRWNCIFHPLVGHSPIYAAALAAGQALRIQQNSDAFFRNAARPSGILTTPGSIDQATAERLQDAWAENYSGENSGAVVVVGNDLKFQPLMMSAVEAQLIDQLKWSAEQICGVFHVPKYKIGIGEVPVRTSVESLDLEYRDLALQKLVEDFEGCLDRGLGLGSDTGVEFDLDGFDRMDSATKAATLRTLTEASIMSANEARFKFDLPPVKGGEEPLSQAQYFSLSALAKRPTPSSVAPGSPDSPSPAAPPGPEPGPPPPPTKTNNIDNGRFLSYWSAGLAREFIREDKSMQAMQALLSC